MIEILAVFRACLELFLHLSRHSSRKLVQPLLTAACITGVYSAVHMTQEGGVLSGLRLAFLENDTTRSERRRIEAQSILQAELHQFAQASKLVDQLLRAMLIRAPGASRVHFDVIHNGVTGLTGIGLLRYDLANSVASPGRAVGEAVVNQPLSEWSPFLPALLAGRCSFLRVAELHAPALQARFEAMGAAAALVCPAADVQGRILGAIFVFWDTNDPIPSDAAVRDLMSDAQHLGGQVAAILDLRGPAPWSPPTDG